MPINIALTAFDVCALILVIGLVACQFAVLPGERARALQAGVRRLFGAALILITLSSIGILVSRTFELTGTWSGFFANLGLALKLTHYGHIWVWRIPALLLLWIAWSWSLRSHRLARVAWALMLIGAVGIALTRSATGHPADHGSFKPSVWVDWVHLVAAAAWVGSLFGMSLAVFPKLLRTAPGSGELSAAVFQRLSTLSGVALAGVLASGIYTAINELGSFHALWTSRYGIVLDVKLFIVILMIAVGAHNRYVKLPRLLRSAGRPEKYSPIRNLIARVSHPAIMTPATAVRSCARAVLVESLLGLAVIAAASVLLHSMAPADMPHSSMAGRTAGFHVSQRQATPYSRLQRARESAEFVAPAPRFSCSTAHSPCNPTFNTFFIPRASTRMRLSSA